MNNTDNTAGPGFRDILRELRVSQWTKNAIVMAAFFFAYWDRQQAHPLTINALWISMAAMMVFCFVSSAVYVANDVLDREADRKHPLKKKRPIAAGRISVKTAWQAAGIIMTAALAAAYVLGQPYLLCVLAYVLIQTVYSLGLKHIPLVDIFVIASGFVLRAIAGAVVIKVDISPWLLLCTFLLALFLALCKRRHEKNSLGESDSEQRISLEKYDTRLLDQLIAVTSATTILSYSIYTLWPETCEKFGTHSLGFTIPFVTFGVFRYLDLVYRHDKGDRPEKILLTDPPILVNIVLYIITLVVILQML